MDVVQRPHPIFGLVEIVSVEDTEETYTVFPGVSKAPRKRRGEEAPVVGQPFTIPFVNYLEVSDPIPTKDAEEKMPAVQRELMVKVTGQIKADFDKEPCDRVYIRKDLSMHTSEDPMTDTVTFSLSARIGYRRA